MRKIDFPYEASVIVMNKNRLDLLVQCLKSVEENTSNVNYELIIVDTLSTDGSRDYLLSNWSKKAVIIFEKDNTSYAASNNRAMRFSYGKYIYLLNNDCIAHAGWLRNAVDFAESDEQIGHVASLVLWPDNTVMSHGSNIAALGYSVIPFKKFNADRPELQQVGNYAYAGFGLYRSDLLEKVGYLPEYNVPIYFDDTAYGLEVWRAGYDVRYCPSSVITHVLYHTERNHHKGAIEQGQVEFMAEWGKFLKDNNGFTPGLPFKGRRPYKNGISE